MLALWGGGMGPHPGPELESKCMCASVHDDDLLESLMLIGMQISSLLTLIRNYLLHAHIRPTIHTHTHFIHIYVACHRVMPLAEKKNNTRMQSIN